MNSHSVGVPLQIPIIIPSITYIVRLFDYLISLVRYISVG